MRADAAKKLANSGYNIAILSSSGKEERLANDLGGIGFTGSNQSNIDLSTIVDLTYKKCSRIDVLVNIAGHGPKGGVLDLTDDNWYDGMNVYFLNVVRATRLIATIMKKQKEGVIINISTFANFEPDKNFPTSGVFRSGLAAFTKLFVDQNSKYNIRMNNILPEFIDSLPKNNELKKKIPLNRYGKKNKISEVINFLASEGAAYITGQNICADGGITKSV